MGTNYFFPLKVSIAGLLCISFMCACFTHLRNSGTLEFGHASFLFRLGMFYGVFLSQLEFSVIVLVFMYLLFIFFMKYFNLHAVEVKSGLFFLFLVGVFTKNHDEYGGFWLHPFFIVYAGMTLLALLLFYVYPPESEYSH